MNIHAEGLVFKAPTGEGDQRGADVHIHTHTHTLSHTHTITHNSCLTRRAARYEMLRSACVGSSAIEVLDLRFCAFTAKSAAASSSAGTTHVTQPSASGTATSSPQLPPTPPKPVAAEKSQAVTTCWPCRCPRWPPRVQAQQ